jgi:uncharacterized protein
LEKHLHRKHGAWSGRFVIVCGGSSGLGLHLVEKLAAQGAKLAIVGRDPERLRQACELATKLGAESASSFSIDLTNTGSQADSIAYSTWLSNQRVDLLINAVGRSDRGALDHLSSNDLRAMFEDNVVCTWYSIHLTLDALKRSKGTIVNIGSLAGLIAAPNMGGYNIAKAGLTALTRQMRLELRKEGIHVMLVCPGPIAREDAGNRYEDLARSRGLDASSGAPGGGAKLKLLDPSILAEKILVCASQRKSELVLPAKAKLLAAIASIWPSLADRILSKYLR